MTEIIIIIIIAVVLLLVIFKVRKNNLEKKRQEEFRQKQLLEEQRKKEEQEVELRRKRAFEAKQKEKQEAEQKQLEEKRKKEEQEAELRRKRVFEAVQKKEQEAEQKKLEEKKHETVNVVFANVKEVGKQTAILKRNDNTYSFVERQNEPFILGSLKLLNETIEKLNWVNEEEFKIREEQEKQEELLRLEQKQVELQKQSDFLSGFGINYLFHMTHKNNLENILQNGLQSHNLARNNQLIKVDIADDKVNIRRFRNEPIYKKSIHDYVPLYFNPKNPMLFVRRAIQNDIVIIAVNKMLIYNKNSLFSDGNAASDDTMFFNKIENLNNLSWECINAEYWNDFNDGRRVRCSEVLAYQSIPTVFIQKIFCNNLVTKQFIENKITNYQTIQAEIKTKLYF